MKSKKVLLIIQDDGFPADTRARNEARTLVGAGYQVSVICPRFGRERLAEVAIGVAEGVGGDRVRWLVG